MLFYLISILVGSYLGQNFLIDSKVKHFIANQIKKLYQQQHCDTLLEIGPGKGALTQHIIDVSKNFYMAERDPVMLGKLKQKFGDEIEEMVVLGDVLEIDMDNIWWGNRTGGTGGAEKLGTNSQKKHSGGTGPSKKILITGNLPYYITSPILRKFFGEGAQDYSGGVFLIQKEVGEKIMHDAHKKSFLRWLLNYSYHVMYLKTVPAKAFSPAPKVQSCVISLIPKQTIPALDFEQLYNFLDTVSGFKRKTLGKIQKMLQKKGQQLSIPENLCRKRLEELDRNDMQNLLANSS